MLRDIRSRFPRERVSQVVRRACARQSLGDPGGWDTGEPMEVVVWHAPRARLARERAAEAGLSLSAWVRACLAGLLESPTEEARCAAP